MKLDLGAGTNPLAGFESVDKEAFPGVQHVVDLREPWPWADGSVEEVHCSHTVEHLTNRERIHFWNELYRVLKPDGKARIITPHWSHACAYGDPTHQWPPMSEWVAHYLDKNWREGVKNPDGTWALPPNAPHVPLRCDFHVVTSGSWDSWLESRSRDQYEFSMQRYINSWRDLILTLTKR